MELIEEIKTDIIERLYERLNQSHYLLDIGYLLTERENSNCSWYCNSYKAKQDIKTYFDQFGYFYEWYEENFGKYPENPFINAERVHCIFMVCAYENIFQQAINYLDIDYKIVEINEEFIASIKDALESVKEIF